MILDIRYPFSDFHFLLSKMFAKHFHLLKRSISSTLDHSKSSSIHIHNLSSLCLWCFLVSMSSSFCVNGCWQCFRPRVQCWQSLLFFPKRIFFHLWYLGRVQGWSCPVGYWLCLVCVENWGEEAVAKPPTNTAKKEPQKSPFAFPLFPLFYVALKETPQSRPFSGSYMPDGKAIT